ncbi:MAG: peptidylprolyl isomerase [Reichenbachiella sp.]|uniref:peptidylprolyl isomerase n=1 Tax=Reichenbachiella sp. TaxID=2184521 RepID=UPI0032636E69
MNTAVKTSALAFLGLFVWTCSKKTESSEPPQEKRAVVEMVTDHGTMIIELYNETPLHRDNFLKLARTGAYDSLLFHRVIEDFMIQGGDPDSRIAKPNEELSEGDVPYTIDEEINPSLFHKKGALGAARDGNPKRASSGMQFYIVHRGVQTDSLIDIAEGRINGWLANHYSKNDSANRELLNAYLEAEAKEDTLIYALLGDSLNALAKDYNDFEKYTIPEAHRAIYKTLGGTPHLDQNYTVFGQVVKGLDVIDAIATVPTDQSDRPEKDVRILSVKVLDQN